MQLSIHLRSLQNIIIYVGTRNAKITLLDVSKCGHKPVIIPIDLAFLIKNVLAWVRFTLVHDPKVCLNFWCSISNEGIRSQKHLKMLGASSIYFLFCKTHKINEIFIFISNNLLLNNIIKK
ncbi:hypothetical protein BpHYR1_016815 [Brachionus plicatilis]|uniref:Uncharacterized protein n=1 Tax=Brachionus plicatilis TaxID=10195 RepID=A0A3M7PW22_BRAPC|nr:hypothetical protein BpHYR1_016815 [Brachionus plicatilis]